MNQTSKILFIVFVLTSCNQGKKAEESKTIDTIASTTHGTAPTNQLTATQTLDCSIFKFKNALDRSDTITTYFDKKQLAAEEKFFCAFPNSFKEMQAAFGFDDKKGRAPLYNYTTGEKMISYFANLNSISKEIYYDKFINICVNGVWEADNIREAFGFSDRLINYTEAACTSLSKRTDKEIKSVFHFIFDGPHPKNEQNEKIYNSLLPILTKQDERLGNLLKESYNAVMTEEDGHGR